MRDSIAALTFFSLAALLATCAGQNGPICSRASVRVMSRVSPGMAWAARSRRWRARIEASRVRVVARTTTQ